MHSFQELQKIINKEINKLAFNKSPHRLYQPLIYLLSSGGKRLRPVLTLMSCELFSGTFEKSVMPAIGIELFHNFTLVHDDIMDKSDIRRHRATVHQKWNENIAILSGDAMAIIAYQYIAKCPEEFLSEVLENFSATALKVCEGQQYDMDFESMEIVTEEEYLKMIELKTAALIACSLRIGAIVGEADQTEQERILHFGKCIGLAFQLQDDYLDVFGNPETFGKATGNDIVTNKKTYLLIKALEKANEKTRGALKSVMTESNIKPEKKIKLVISIYKELQIREEVNRNIERLHNEALKHLSQINVDDIKKKVLISVANSLINRTQ
ncbi:MAG: polyprenyl synthetase family protein [Bacteroidia bacterium]|nr:polyprenyl synthetase family protein [Bacteroidia bacterium]